MTDPIDTEAIAATLNIAKKTGAVNAWLDAYRRDVSTLLAALATEREKVERIAELLKTAEKLLRPFVNYGEMLEAKNLLTEALDLANYHKATGPQAENEPT